ncbi:MAG TPA: hypothetical protein VHE32_07415 [Rhodanobacteraceae bacterium]|nr:hypothetical protein [Rhodanobacteraceae bacterium]
MKRTGETIARDRMRVMPVGRRRVAALAFSRCYHAGPFARVVRA